MQHQNRAVSPVSAADIANAARHGWSAPFNFGALMMPAGWSVRWCENTEMWFAVRGDDPDDGNTGVCFSSPHMARRHAIAIQRHADSASGGT
ncbi:MAG: hypothetical protein SFV24_19310 [Gemmatimonadales bacterium]|nr:hypothetical protein [Gemmatimonadales bacterium]